MQAGVLGGHLRVASVGAFDVDSQRGLEMMALGPLDVQGASASDYDAVFVAVRPHTTTLRSAGGELKFKVTTSADFEYYQASLDRRYGQTSKPIGAAVFYSKVLEHAIEWNAAFAPGMQVKLPYSERRQVDMAKGVLVSTSTVFVGNHPNYGTDTYWMSSPPATAMMDTNGIADSLPLTSLSLDTALLQWGLFPSALDKIGFYFDTFIYQNGV